MCPFSLRRTLRLIDLRNLSKVTEAARGGAGLPAKSSFPDLPSPEASAVHVVLFCPGGSRVASARPLSRVLSPSVSLRESALYKSTLDDCKLNPIHCVLTGHQNG